MRDPNDFHTADLLDYIQCGKLQQSSPIFQDRRAAVVAEYRRMRKGANAAHKRTQARQARG